MFLLKILLWPLSLIYQVIFYFDQKRKKPTKLNVTKTISVGNLSVGGTGKTPFTIHLSNLICNLLPDAKIAVLSRGYGGRSSIKGKLVKIDSDPKDSGDEPLLLKRNLPNCEIIVGRDRIRSFNIFSNIINYKSSFAILDDGFQHRQIHRDLDIVLIDSKRLLSNGFTIPAGHLREKWTALDRAHIVVFTKCRTDEFNHVSDSNFPIKESSQEQLKDILISKNNKKTSAMQKLESQIRSKFPKIKIFHSIEKLECLVSYDEHSKMITKPLESIESNRVFGFTGLANPDSFLQSIQKLKPSEFHSKIYPDHYSYPPSSINFLETMLFRNDLLICTEKDFVKFSLSDISKFGGKLFYMKMSSEIIENDQWVKYWESVLHQ
ncbi:tetraacyldisaccharide 4'-kinase [Leptospira sp. GIMC2001]|uniref:tetraacyldisaccharide 4'-kinase n=1 Tax=Leptospira sp. GIMC2001 TaxID=1513297 RepID=UPI00234A71D1|nr:tetraacyldisaccharide 4'-kinase [Leptospira sp. GIMC2001]WCL48575.1 tetraacyldisaccharide 4'-kinase [Leptospira sp. GIMC2001]